MREFLTEIAKLINISNYENYDEETLKELILKQVNNRLAIETAVFNLSEDFAWSCEISLRVISTICRIIDKINSQKNIYEFITYCFDEFIKILPIENISFMEKHPRWNYLILKAASGKIKLDEFHTKKFNIDKSFCGYAYKNKYYVYTPYASMDERFDKTLSTLPIKTLLSVPVKIQKEIIGVINYSHSKENAFDELTIFYFVSMTELFSAILTLFKLYKENLHYRRKLEKEIIRKSKELLKISKKFYKESITDVLTGLYNRRLFFKRLDEEFSKFLRYGNSFCLIIFDLDALKKINDTFGHSEGDRILKLFAKILKTNKRKEDIVARIGGDEFASIVFVSAEGALKFAEKIREQIKSSYKKAPVSVSGGVGCIGKGCSFKYYKNYREFFNDVDKMLLKAKKTKDSIALLET
ncbi:sensor domain-containing diguanylate cyclase [Thermodesulfovibrio hydrogeniphilus]